MHIMLKLSMDFFQWHLEKETQNISKHGIDFETAKQAFKDPNRIIAVDDAHSKMEPRYFCIGMGVLPE